MTKTLMKVWQPCYRGLSPRKRERLLGKIEETDPEDLALRLAQSRVSYGAYSDQAVKDMALLIDARLREQNELLRKLLDRIGSDGGS